MNQILKQRLVGTVVITALATIFVPMLFDEPININRTDKINTLKTPNPPVYDDHLTPLPKNIDAVIHPKTSSTNKVKSPDSITQPPSTKMQRWFIQAGVFKLENNAVALRNIILKQGFPAFISPILTDTGIMYQTKVGPELDKKRAQQIKEKLDKLNNIKTILLHFDKW